MTDFINYLENIRAEHTLAWIAQGLATALSKDELARNLVQQAVRKGTLTKPNKCEMCSKGRKKIEGHHPDYHNPLEVLWLCQHCHRSLHIEIGFSETTNVVRTSIPVHVATAYKLKLRAAIEGKTVMKLVDELSTLRATEEFLDELSK